MAAVINKLLLLKKRLLLIAILHKRRIVNTKRRKKKIWVRQLFAERCTKSVFITLIEDLRLHDQQYFFQTFRMDSSTFELLLSWIGPLISKSSLRRPVATPAERLVVTLRYLATGQGHIELAKDYRMSPATVGRVIRDTCTAIWDVILKRGYLSIPNSNEEWKDIARDFEVQWNFPHCIGAIDGKHIVIQAPARSGSTYFNYKKTFSIVLMAICDANCFTLVDIGDAGRQSDAGVYSSSQIGRAIEQNKLKMPSPEPLVDYDNTVFPYCFVGDEAFALKPHMMRPYPRVELSAPERIYNYRLSRARRVIENSFGILASRFRIFRGPIIAGVETVKKVTKASIALHNFLMRRKAIRNKLYCPIGFVDREDGNGKILPGEWRNTDNGLLPIQRQGTNNYTKTAKTIRDDFKTYFNSESGAVSWQQTVLRSTTCPFDEV